MESSAEFNKMPIEIVGKILSNLDDPFEKIRMRRVCRDFRDIIDDQLSRCKKMSLWFEDVLIKFEFDNRAITYRAKRNNGFSVTCEDSGKIIDFDGKEMMELLRNQSIYLLQNYRLKLDEFYVAEDSHWIREDDDELVYLPEIDVAAFLKSILDKLNHQIVVKTFLSLPDTTISNQIGLLQHLKPDSQQKIEVGIEEEDIKGEDMEKLYQMDHWKLPINRYLHADFICDLSIHLNMLRQATSWMIRRPDFIPEEIIQIKEILLQLPNFKSGMIDSQKMFLHTHEFEPIKSALGPFTVSPKDPERCYYPIPSSDEFLEFRFRRYCSISVRRTKSIFSGNFDEFSIY